MIHANSRNPCTSSNFQPLFPRSQRRLWAHVYHLMLRARCSPSIIPSVKQNLSSGRSTEVCVRVTCLSRVKSSYFNACLLIVDTQKNCLLHLLKFPTHPGFYLPIGWHPASDPNHCLLFNPSMSSMEIVNQFLPYCIITDSFQGTQTWCLSFRVVIQNGNINPLMPAIRIIQQMIDQFYAL